MHPRNEILHNENGLSGRASDPLRGVAGFEARYPAFPDQDAYIESWGELLRSILVRDADSATQASSDPAAEFEVINGRAAESLRTGIPIPIESYVRCHQLDRLDHIILMALLTSAIDSEGRAGADVRTLEAMTGSSIVRRRRVLRRRLDGDGKLPCLGILQHDGDLNIGERVYRINPRWAPVILGEKKRPSECVELPRDPFEAYEVLMGDLGALHRLLYKPERPGSIWHSRVETTGSWRPDESIRAEIRWRLAAMRREAIEPLGKLIREERLDPASSLTLSCLVYFHASGNPTPYVQNIKEMAGLSGSHGDSVEKILGPEGPLVSYDIVELQGPGPLRARKVRINPALLEDLVPFPVGLPDKEEEDRPPGVADPVELIESDGRTLDGLVLSPQLRERIEFHTRSAVRARDVLVSWGFQNTARMKPALLFHGPSGTGKTAAARAIATELGVKLFRIRFEQIRSRWSGETEKQVSRAFRRAAEANALLLLDEADAIVGDREENYSHETTMTNLLLQEIEAFQGPMVLTTNRIDVLDQALERRLSAKLEFPLPGIDERKALWRLYLPAGAPLAADVNLDSLARHFELSGAGIERACLEAAATAAGRPEADRIIRMSDLLTAAQDGAGKWSRRRPVGFRELEARAALAHRETTVEYVQEARD